MKTRSLFMIAVTGALIAGCSTEKVHQVLRADAAPVSKFLPHHELLVAQPATFPFHFFYLNEKAAVYENIYIAPVNVDHLRESEWWEKLNQELAGKLGTHVSDLEDFTRKAYQQAFRQAKGDHRLKVVEDRNLPKTLVLEPAIIGVKFTKAGLNAAGTTASFFVPGLGVVSSVMSAGSINVECRISDAKTGEIVAMYADTEKDPRAAIPLSSYTWAAPARINIKSIAEQTAKVLSAKDYRTIRRDFPFRLISRIKDGDL